MPGMTTFVNDWRAARGDPPKAVTAKSYFLQEAEGLSRRAKVEWARLRGDVPVTNLQHDGVIMDPPQEMQRAELEATLSEVCEAALGYKQPVEEKEFDADVSDTDEDEA